MHLSKTHIYLFVVLAVFLYTVAACSNCVTDPMTRMNVNRAAWAMLMVALVLFAVKAMMLFKDKKRFYKVLTMFFVLLAVALYAGDISLYGYFGMEDDKTAAVVFAGMALMLMLCKKACFGNM